MSEDVPSEDSGEEKFIDRENMTVCNMKAAYRIEIRGGSQDGLSFVSLEYADGDEKRKQLAFPLSELSEVIKALTYVYDNVKAELEAQSLFEGEAPPDDEEIEESDEDDE